MIFYDTETQHLFDEIPGSREDQSLLLFGCAVTYDTKTDLYRFFWKNQKDELIEYLTGNVVVGFNSINFDNTVLLGTNWRDKKLWYDIDIKEEITKQVFKVSSTEEACLMYHPSKVHGGFGLSKICLNTLKIKKNQDTLIIPQLIREDKDIHIIFEYNLQDIRLTRRLLEHITDEGWIINGYGKKYDIKISKKIWRY